MCGGKRIKTPGDQIAPSKPGETSKTQGGRQTPARIEVWGESLKGGKKTMDKENTFIRSTNIKGGKRRGETQKKKKDGSEVKGTVLKGKNG